MKITREPNRLPERGAFRRIALQSRSRWAGGYTFWARGRTMDRRYTVTGLGSTARKAVNDLVRERIIAGRLGES